MKQFISSLISVAIALTLIPVLPPLSTSALDGTVVNGVLIIPPGTMEIPSAAFRNRLDFTSVSMPESLITIGANAFNGTNLTTVTIPASVRTIGTASGPAFGNTPNLTTASFAAGSTAIPANAFNGATALTSVTIPDTVTSIGNSAFRRTALTTVTLPAAVTSMGMLSSPSFGDIDTLTSVIFAEGATTIPNYAFVDLPNLTSVTIPSTVTSIGVSAFRNTGLISITLPSGLTSTGTISSPPFAGATSLTEVIFAEGTTEIPANVLNGVTNLKSITIPDTVTSIGNYAFRRTALTTVTIPASVTSMGTLSSPSFGDVDTLTSVIFAEGMTAIPNYAFAYSEGLTSVTIPNTVTSIGVGAFRNTGLTSVTIPAGAISAGTLSSPPFANTPLLTTAIFAEGTTAIPANIFYNAQSLMNVTIPETVTSIGSDAFRRTALVNVTLHEGITTIGNRAFAETGLFSVTIPSTITSMGSGGTGSFTGCEYLMDVIFAEGTTNILASAFVGIPSLSEVVIPDSVTSIGAAAFDNCPALTWVEIPPSVRTIGNNAFGYWLDDSERNIRKKIEDFTVYACLFTAGSTYAQANGFKLVHCVDVEDCVRCSLSIIHTCDVSDCVVVCYLHGTRTCQPACSCDVLPCVSGCMCVNCAFIPPETTTEPQITTTLPTTTTTLPTTTTTGTATTGTTGTTGTVIQSHAVSCIECGKTWFRLDTETTGHYCPDCRASMWATTPPTTTTSATSSSGTTAPTTVSGWTCECGVANTGNFCSNCGSAKPVVTTTATSPTSGTTTTTTRHAGWGNCNVCGREHEYFYVNPTCGLCQAASTSVTSPISTTSPTSTTTGNSASWYCRECWKHMESWSATGLCTDCEQKVSVTTTTSTIATPSTTTAGNHWWVLNANGGLFWEYGLESVPHTRGAFLTPTRAGYTFNGWYTEPVGGELVTHAEPFGPFITIYAQWVGNSATSASTVTSATTTATTSATSPISATTTAPTSESSPTTTTTPVAANWTCECGVSNTGNFCSDCGKARPTDNPGGDRIDCNDCEYCGDVAATPNAGRRGYVLGNTNVTTADALEILKYIVKLPGAVRDCENSKKAANIMGNDIISTADALEVLKKIVKLPNKIVGTA